MSEGMQKLLTHSSGTVLLLNKRPVCFTTNSQEKKKQKHLEVEGGTWKSYRKRTSCIICEMSKVSECITC